MGDEFDDIFKFKLGEVVNLILSPMSKLIIINRIINQSGNGYLITYLCSKPSTDECERLVMISELEIEGSN